MSRIWCHQEMTTIREKFRSLSFIYIILLALIEQQKLESIFCSIFIESDLSVWKEKFWITQKLIKWNDLKNICIEFAFAIKKRCFFHIFIRLMAWMYILFYLLRAKVIEFLRSKIYYVTKFIQSHTECRIELYLFGTVMSWN